MEIKIAQRWAQVAVVAGTQHGRIHIRQLRAIGISGGAVEKAVRSGRLHREHRGVYAVGHIAGGAHGRWMSAVLACGDGAVLSHRSAATLWGIREAEGPRVDVSVPTRNGRRRPGIAVHRASLSPEDAATRFGIPVTTVARALADLAFVLDQDAMVRTVREAQYRGLFELAAVERAHARRPSGALGLILGDLTSTDSRLEDDFLRLIDRHGLPRPTRTTLFGHRVDFIWQQAMLVVETDGARAHLTLDAFQRDRSQTNAMQLAGYLVLRFTAADIRRRPGRVAAQIREALGRLTPPREV